MIARLCRGAKRLAVTLFAGLGLVAAGAEVAWCAAASEPLVTARALALAMRGGRSAEAEVRYDLVDPLGGPARVVRGRVRVESPDRVRLDFTTSGERIALRGDGGEWLQPAARQLLRIPAERAAGALQWWRVLLPESRDTFREESLSSRRFRLAPRAAGAGPIRMMVRLDARGLPADLVVEGVSDAPVTYRISNWKFPPERGAAAYRLVAPPGFETVDLP